MPDRAALKPSVVAIFGAKGDLSKRKLVPALFNLFLEGSLPRQFLIIGIGRGMEQDEFRRNMREAVDRFSRRGKAKDEDWARFEPMLTFLTATFDDGEAFPLLAQRIADAETEWATQAVRVYYLSTPPELIQTLVTGLESVGLSQNRALDRIVIEKPFGSDLASAEELNGVVDSAFLESQVYRIDHYLGKETVQNILALRFGNALFEPVWNRRYIDHIQITVAEEVGVEKRGKFYEQAGALRDMVQNHLIQLLSMVAMEPPVSFDADEIRNKKVDVLRAMRPIQPGQIYLHAVRGQYGAGWSRQKRVPAYRSEEGVAPNSSTETFAALKLYVDNWRWQNVPFYLRTGKRMPTRATQISIQFKPVPHQIFPSSAGDTWEPNRLLLNIQPHESIVVRFQAKQPGRGMRLRTVNMSFGYEESFHVHAPEAYETLLYDVMVGDGTLFMRADQEQLAWKVVTPVLEAWQRTPSSDFPNYPAGTWGPEAGEALIARDGRSWHSLPLPEDDPSE